MSTHSSAVDSLVATQYQEAILHIKPEIGDNWFVDMRTEEVALEAIEHLRNQTAPDGQ